MSDIDFLLLAASQALPFVGATAPNPPVGAAIVKDDQVIGLGAHERAGSAHAEVNAIEEAAKLGCNTQGSTLYVTLEPCNHTGKTPPCTDAIKKAGITRVVFGVKDPNAGVKGGGADALKKAGIFVEYLDLPAVRELNAPFVKRCKTGRPWVVHKRAFRVTRHGDLTMIPERNANTTFTSPESLQLAHIERKKSEAILTTLPTILADRPQFNVRLVRDHAQRTIKRKIAIVSRSNSDISQLPKKAQDWWTHQVQSLGHELKLYPSIESALDALGADGVLRVLIEAGPKLSATLEGSDLWDERITFFAGTGSSGTHGAEDRVLTEFRS